MTEATLDVDPIRSEDGYVPRWTQQESIELECAEELISSMVGLHSHALSHVNDEGGVHETGSSPSRPISSMGRIGLQTVALLEIGGTSMELKPQGIHVTALCPGFTRSEFHDAMGTRGQADKLPGFLWQDAAEVVREGWAAVMAGKPICVPGTVNKLMTSAMRPIPLGLQYLLGKRLNPFKQK